MLRQVAVIVTGDEATCFSDHGDFANIRRAQPDRGWATRLPFPQKVHAL